MLDVVLLCPLLAGLSGHHIEEVILEVVEHHGEHVQGRTLCPIARPDQCAATQLL